MEDSVPHDELQTPVLLVIFNRPEVTALVFDAIRKARPAKLYVAADGPRPNVPTDSVRCARAREIVSRVDWPCDVHTLFRETNLGCGISVSSAITWLFQNEDQGIILEDDCLPSQSFFWYCQELLDRYHDDTRVMHIGGNNYLKDGQRKLTYSYYFARNGHVWGWATWKRAWKYFDHDMILFEEIKHGGFFQNFFLNPLEKFYRLRKFNQLSSQKKHVWDYHWDFARYSNSGLAIVPTRNLVRNIGFGRDATHTRGLMKRYSAFVANEITVPLRHPPLVLRDIESERQYFSNLMTEIVASKVMLT